MHITTPHTHSAVSFLKRLRLALVASLVIIAVWMGGLPARAGQRTTGEVESSRLKSEIERLAELAGGRVGVGALHLETGRAVYLHGDERFPMASTYKIPIAVQVLTRVDREELTLDRLVTLRRRDLRPGSGLLARWLDESGGALSVHTLLELMLVISDNTATDVLLRLAGGPSAVTRRLRELGIEGIRVDRPTLEIIADWAGVKASSLLEMPPTAFGRFYESLPEEKRRAAAATFNADPRDTATPAAMVRLLQEVWRGRALSRERTELLFDIMRRCQTGARRIKGFLPPGTEVAHKTGTIGGTTNDVGIITLPHGAGHLALAVFVKESTEDIAEREQAIAHIARALYDDFLFRPEDSERASSARMDHPISVHSDEEDGRRVSRRCAWRIGEVGGTGSLGDLNIPGRVY